ncbi:MAG TPA: hypothetical protein VEV81_04695 [Pyrinomonadaceae bacterium]|nr:hypothetical protein [Pyrinomonadaceae bacterium]
MTLFFRLALILAVLLATATLVCAQTERNSSQVTASNGTTVRERGALGSGSEGERKAAGLKEAADTPASDPNSTIADPLVRILIVKGVLTEDEGHTISAAGTPAEQRDRLAALLRDKGLISTSEFEAVRTVAPTAETSPTTAALSAATTDVLKPEAAMTAEKQSAPPTVIAAIAPTRLLQVDPPKREGLIPDIKLGTGARLKLYGIFKTSLVYDSSSPQGNDFPLPLLAADTGPTAGPEFHLRARGLRLGANFEWLDPAPNTVITGRLEFDFEGNFTRVNNRNISSIRSSQPSIRLAWARIDRKFTEKTTGFALFGQDWTPFLSSTLPNMIENTNFGGLGFGAAYERAPQARFGLNYDAGGSYSLKFQPEFALVLPAFGDLPANVTDQLGFGERQGVDSARPAIQGRFVTQWQLDKASGVVPAQFILSFEHQRRSAIVTAANVPAAFRAAFPSGAEVSSSSNGYSVEVQLPTRAVTVVSKYYNGSDLRFFFAGQFLSNFNDTAGLTGTATATSIDGASTVVFGLLDGVPVVAPERPVRAQGGFIQLGFPLSRIFDADPKGRNSGWSAYLYYGYDQATARDARRFGARGSRSDLFSGNIQYKLNSFVTFAYEQGYYRTRAANRVGALPLFRGIPSYTTHNVRSEFATIFTF